MSMMHFSVACAMYFHSKSVLFMMKRSYYILTAVVERSGLESWEIRRRLTRDAQGCISLIIREVGDSFRDVLEWCEMPREGSTRKQPCVFIFSPAGIACASASVLQWSSHSLFREREHTDYSFFSSSSLLTACCSAVRREPLLVLVPLDGSCVEEVSHCVVLAITTSQVISKTTSTSPYVLQTQSSSTYHFCKKLSACLL